MTILLVITTVPEMATAKTLADMLVARRLAACVNMLPGLVSVFRWHGKVEHAGEVLLLIKTTADQYAELEATLRGAHPYELPEIIALQSEQALAAYTAWVVQETSPTEI